MKTPNFMGKGAAFAATILVLLGGSVEAATINYTAFLDGLQEVPLNASPGFGEAHMTLDTDTNLFSVVALTFSGLIGTTTAAHVHGAAPFGVNAGVVFPLFIDLGVTAGGLAAASSSVFSPTMVANLNSDLLYINIHTSAFPGGEIRGQIQQTPVPEPASLMLMGIGTVGLFGYSWRRKAKAA